MVRIREVLDFRKPRIMLRLAKPLCRKTDYTVCNEQRRQSNNEYDVSLHLMIRTLGQFRVDLRQKTGHGDPNGVRSDRAGDGCGEQRPTHPGAVTGKVSINER